MAKITAKAKKGPFKQKKEMSFPLAKENFIIIGIGILDLIIGYIFLAQDSVDGFAPTVIAPILLVIGYCIIIPYGILKKPKSELENVAETEDNSTSNVSIASPVSSNIKTS
jgi:hypothetical protein